jgi:outer membrane protein TolC
MADGFAAEPPPPAQPVAPAPAPVLDLRACRQIALERQPAIAAANASLAAAVARSQALDHLHVPALIARDLPTRRKQAALGVTIGQAGVLQAEWDTLHGVTYTYLAALYARQQQEVAEKAYDDLKTLQDLAKEIVKTGSRPDVTNRHVDQIGVYLLVAQGRREEAVEGAQRALVALREAMGVGCDFPFSVAGSELPAVHPAVDREQVVAAALARRGELVQASNAAQVTCFEIDAQKALLMPNARTFASGSDIHAGVVPQGSHDSTYKPGAVGLEMPPMLPGGRNGRIDQARAYHARAEAVVDKTRNLVALEAEETYLRWLEASRKTPKLKEAADAADKLAKGLRERFDPRVVRITLDEVLNAGVLATQMRLQANEAYFQELISLASLERDTAGGFCAGFEEAFAK